MLKTIILYFLLFCSSSPNCQALDTVNSEMIKKYKKALYQNCSSPVSGVQLDHKNVNFKADKNLMVLCSEIYASFNVLQKFQELNKYGLHLRKKTHYDTSVLYEYTLIGKRHQNLNVFFEVWTTKLKKVKSINMGMLTNTHTFCNDGSRNELSTFDIFYFERLIQYIKFNFVLRPNAVDVWFYYTPRGEEYLQE